MADQRKISCGVNRPPASRSNALHARRGTTRSGRPPVTPIQRRLPPNTPPRIIRSRLDTHSLRVRPAGWFGFVSRTSRSPSSPYTRHTDVRDSRRGLESIARVCACKSRHWNSRNEVWLTIDLKLDGERASKPRDVTGLNEFDLAKELGKMSITDKKDGKMNTVEQEGMEKESDVRALMKGVMECKREKAGLETIEEDDEDQRMGEGA
ncbi:hypothetical protein FB567DRAFT_555401 [Paraphoma chrysanthemicola]|uniref:Uncharacterized protein n=1 Tax=Paraphoma chrysanthemicola TaxID=798071 RepID=A0A8K0QSJ9_9PLEO|nr:hypothetical protein FB567DRAFT_555401 [Paraphoma chrysanthemicola]